MEDFFQKHKEKISEAIKANAKDAGLSGDFTLVEGLVFNDIQKDPKKLIIGGGQRIPLIAVVDNHTGRMHYFALKVLIPNIEDLS